MKGFQVIVTAIGALIMEVEKHGEIDWLERFLH